jgi:hypothetical protein
MLLLMVEPVVVVTSSRVEADLQEVALVDMETFQAVVQEIQAQHQVLQIMLL